MSYRIVTLVAVLMGCSRDANPAAPAVEAMVTMDSMAPAQPAAMPFADAVSNGALSADRAAAPAVAGVANRMIVRNARLSLQVAEVRQALAEINRLAGDLHGFVGTSRRWSEGERDLASLTLRVPVIALDSALARLRGLAVRVDDETLGGEDVTAQAVDLGAQLTNLRATEAELRALLATVRQRTQKASDVLEVHTELSRIRGEIEQRTAQLQSLSQLAALATITIDLRPDAVTVPVVAEGWQPRAVLHDATRALVATGRSVAEAAIWMAVVGLPALLVALALGTGLRALLRRVLRRRRGAVPSPMAS